ncbi:MAG: bidirectional hydrogenase complex protein HoxU [Acidimicrobiia bacterium]
MPERRPTVSISLDDTEVEAFEGESVLQAARRNRIDIPSLCFLEGVSVFGACRICVVEVSEQRQLRPACATQVTEDMEVWTNTAKLRSHRRAILELLFAEGNHVCAVCVANGNCELQDRAVEAGMDHVRFDYQSPARPVDASHPKYLFDPNRCILCTRCVRVCDEIEGAHVWDIASRGHHAYLVTDLGQPWGESTSCTWCGKCVASCPTGALAYQGLAVGEMKHMPDLVARLVSARRDHEWIEP